MLVLIWIHVHWLCAAVFGAAPPSSVMNSRRLMSDMVLTVRSDHRPVRSACHNAAYKSPGADDGNRGGALLALDRAVGRSLPCFPNGRIETCPADVTRQGLAAPALFPVPRLLPQRRSPPSDAALGHGSESKTKLAGTLRPDDFDYQTQGRGGCLHRWNDRSADRIVGI
jgi:hypothetical protein